MVDEILLLIAKLSSASSFDGRLVTSNFNYTEFGCNNRNYTFYKD
jgi:hypothetical protein